MVDKKTIGLLIVMILLSGAVYITLSGQGVKIRVDKDKATFYVFDDNIHRWVVGGREYNKLFDGSSLMHRNLSSIYINVTNTSDTVTITRFTKYIRGPIIIDTWFFNGKISDKKLFPIYHKIQVINGSRLFYRYEARDLDYSGQTHKLNGETHLDFGKHITVNLQKGYRWAWVYKSGIVKAQYDIDSDNKTFYIRLFDPTWIIDNNKVYVNDYNVYSSVEPHTLHSPGWIYWDFKSKVYSGNVDMLWGFNTTLGVRPVKAELKYPHNVSWNTTHSKVFYNVSFSPTTDSCDYGYEYNTHKYLITYTEPFYNAANSTDWNSTSAVVCFDLYEDLGNSDYRAIWHQEHTKTVNWLDVSNRFNSIDYEFGGMNKWYYVTNIPIQKNVQYTMRAYVKVPVSLEPSSGKYWVAFKPSSESLHQAIQNGHLYYLDPWWNTSFSYRRRINITNSDIYNYNNVSVVFWFNHDGKANSDCSDIRIADESSNTNQFGLRNCNSTHVEIVMRVDVNANSYNDTWYVYYGNNTPVNFANSSWNDVYYDLWDEFEGTSLDTSKWTVWNDVTYTVENGKLKVTDSSHGAWQSKNGFNSSWEVRQNGFRIDMKGLSWSTSASKLGVLYAWLWNGTDGTESETTAVNGFIDAWNNIAGTEIAYIEGTEYKPDTRYDSLSNQNITIIIYPNNTIFTGCAGDSCPNNATKQKISTIKKFILMTWGFSGYDFPDYVYIDSIYLEPITQSGLTTTFGSEETGNLSPIISYVGVTQYTPANSTQYPVTPTFEANITDPDDDYLYVYLYYNGTQINATGTNTTTYKYSVTTPTLGAGLWNITWEAYDGTATSTDTFWYEVNKAYTETTLLINGSHSNQDFYLTDVANFTVSVNVTGKTVHLNTNMTGWAIQSGTTPLYNYTTLSEIGYFNVTGYFSGDENYSSSSDTLFINVTFTIHNTNVTVTLNGEEADRYYEYGSTVRIKANVTDGSGNLIQPQNSDEFCLSIDAVGYGENYTCDDDLDGEIEYNFTSFSSMNRINGSLASLNLTFGGQGNQTYVNYNKYDSVINFSFGLYAFQKGLNYLHNLTLDIGNDGNIDFGLIGDFGKLAKDIVNNSEFLNGEKNITEVWNGGTTTEYEGEVKTIYIRVPTNLNVSSAYFNITASPNGNATRKALTLNWAQTYARGGYNLSYSWCWAPVGGIIGHKYYQIGGKCLEPYLKYNNTIYYNIATDSMGTTIDLPYEMMYGCSVSYDSDNDGETDEIYIFGGEDASSNPIDTAYKFDGSTYTALTSMPDARATAACVLMDDMVYIFGGDNATVIKYSITEDKWYFGGNIGDSTIEMSQAAQFNATHILHWGGYGNIDIDLYDTTTDTFTDTGENFKLYGGIGLSLKNANGDYDIYHIGGYYNSWNEGIYKYNKTTKQFERISPDFNWNTDWPNSYNYYNTIYQGGTSFGIYNGTLYASPNTVNAYESFLFRLKFFPQNPYIIVGDTSNSPIWSFTGGFTSYEERGSDASGGAKIIQKTDDFAQDINEYIVTHNSDYYCDIPIYIHSGSAGKITLQSLNITWNTTNIILNASVIQEYLDSSSNGVIQVPLVFNSTQNGTLEINNVKSHYYGSDNITVTANYTGNATYYASHDSHIIKNVYSNYSKSFPFNVHYLEFMPTSNAQENITPYGQTDSIPIWNFTSLGYDKPINISVYWNNSSYEPVCANITLSLDNTRDAGDFKLTNESQTLIPNLAFQQNQSVWAWLDLNASQCGNPRWINIDLVWESYCTECVR